MKHLNLPHILELPYREVSKCCEDTKDRNLLMGYISKKIRLFPGAILVRPTVYNTGGEKYELQQSVTIHGDMLVCCDMRKLGQLRGLEEDILPAIDRIRLAKKYLFLFRFKYGDRFQFYTNHAELADQKTEIGDSQLIIRRREELDIPTPGNIGELV